MKVVLVSSITPSGHYSQYLTEGLACLKDVQLISYVGKNEKTSKLKKNGVIRHVWSKNLLYIPQILQQLLKDKPDLVHIQQEFNMYGNVLTAALFPVLILAIRLAGFKVVTTIHAAVYKKQVTQKFVWLFNGKSFMKPFMLKSFFHYIYICTALFSNKVIAHTNRKLDILTHDYFINPNRISVIPVIIPFRKRTNSVTKPYFFYFGYMVRRKGIEELIAGFNSFITTHPKPSYQLIMAGGTIRGQENALQEIKNIIQKFGLSERVILRGFIEESEQHKLYAESTAVVIPSLVSFGFSGPLYHAFSYHKCVLASNEGYFKEIIANNENGVLVKNNNWASSLHTVASNNSLRKLIEKKVMSQAKLQAPSKVAKEYLRLYQSL